MGEEKQRHPFRFMFKIAALGAVLYFTGRILAQKKEEYYGLSESEARAKLQEKLGPRIGDDSAAEVADQVIPRLKKRGIITADVAGGETETGGETEAAKE